MAAGGVVARRDGLAPLVGVHVALFAAVPAEFFAAPWAGVGPASLAFAGLAVAAAGLRYWAAAALGPRYTIRVVRLPGAPLVRRGPYRWMRHPIYAAVAVEVLALPLVVGAYVSAAALTAANLAALARRIRREEAFLGLRAGPA